MGFLEAMGAKMILSRRLVQPRFEASIIVAVTTSHDRPALARCAKCFWGLDHLATKQFFVLFWGQSTRVVRAKVCEPRPEELMAKAGKPNEGPASSRGNPPLSRIHMLGNIGYPTDDNQLVSTLPIPS